LGVSVTSLATGVALMAIAVTVLQVLKRTEAVLDAQNADISGDT